jgi:hypothetical protein
MPMYDTVEEYKELKQKMKITELSRNDRLQGTPHRGFLRRAAPEAQRYFVLSYSVRGKDGEKICLVDNDDTAAFWLWR